LAVLLGIGAFFCLQKQKGEVPTQITPPKEGKVEVSTPALVEISKDGFVPATISVKKGQVVVWTNNDQKPHQVATDPYPSNDTVAGLLSDPLTTGDSFSFTFDQTGTFTYHDNLNPLKLKGTIVVE
jgi:plastocyanin